MRSTSCRTPARCRRPACRACRGRGCRASCPRCPCRACSARPSPAFIRAFSKPIRRVSSSIRPMVDAAVGLPSSPCRRRRCRAPWRPPGRSRRCAPEVISSFRFGQGLEHRARKRRALAHRADDLEVLAGAGVGLVGGERLVEHGDVDPVGDRRPVGQLQRHVLIVVENCTAQPRHRNIHLER